MVGDKTTLSTLRPARPRWAIGLTACLVEEANVIYNWPVNEMRCSHDGCEDTGTTPCFLVLYRHDLSLFGALFLYGLKQAWRFWREGSIEILDGFYCAEHAYEEGFCWNCGNFYSGASERFDFRIGGQWMCDGCWSNFYEHEPEGEWEEDYYPGLWDD